MIDFDCESTGLQPWSGTQEVFLWIFGDDDGNVEAIPFQPSVHGEDHPNRMRIQEWFDKAKTDEEGIRAWNAKFDKAWAVVHGFDIPGDGKWHDEMLRAQAIDERRSVALKAVSRDLFGEDADAHQKAVKEWLAAERRRRCKVIADAGKAQAGKLRIKYEDPDTGKNKTRKATEEECAAVIAEAEELTAEYGMREPDYSTVPSEIMIPYAKEDVILTRAVAEVHEPIFEQSSDLRKLYEFERESMDALFAVEQRGLPADADGYRKLELEVIENLDKLEDRCMQLAGEANPVVYAKELDKFIESSEDESIVSVMDGGSLLEFNPRSTAHILAAIKARGANMSFMQTEGGKIKSADKDNLKAVDDDLAAAILDFRSEYKVLTTYIRPMLGRHYETRLRAWKEPFLAPDGRIHANYRQVGARTGRMSCSDPNMQNQPRDDLRQRYNIRAEPGYSLITCDLSNVEMVLFAAYCGEGRLLDAVRAGEDLHLLTAKMLGLRDRRRPGGGIETARQLGKTYNFSRVYGGGLRTIRRQFRCDTNQARIYRNRFDNAYPEVRRLTNRIEDRLAEDGYVQDKLISGRRFRVSRDEAYKGTNYLVQGTAAALLKYAMVKLHKDGVPMVALVHDEILAHVPTPEAAEAANLIEQRMTEFEGLKGIVPLRAEAEIVQHWSDAKPLKDDDGKPYLFTPQWAGGEKRYITD
jgi:DNA polymerase I-like protein with 3'-5' exonuclease and polymerase domains